MLAAGQISAVGRRDPPGDPPAAPRARSTRSRSSSSSTARSRPSSPTKQGVTVTPADVDARLTEEATTPELRHAWVIAVKPALEEGKSEPTDAADRRGQGHGRQGRSRTSRPAGTGTRSPRPSPRTRPRTRPATSASSTTNSALDAAFLEALTARRQGHAHRGRRGGRRHLPRRPRDRDRRARRGRHARDRRSRTPGSTWRTSGPPSRRDVTRTKLSDAVLAQYLAPARSARSRRSSSQFGAERVRRGRHQGPPHPLLAQRRPVDGRHRRRGRPGLDRRQGRGRRDLREAQGGPQPVRRDRPRRERRGLGRDDRRQAAVRSRRRTRSTRPSPPRSSTGGFQPGQLLDAGQVRLRLARHPGHALPDRRGLGGQAQDRHRRGHRSPSPTPPATTRTTPRPTRAATSAGSARASSTRPARPRSSRRRSARSATRCTVPDEGIYLFLVSKEETRAPDAEQQADPRDLRLPDLVLQAEGRVRDHARRGDLRRDELTRTRGRRADARRARRRGPGPLGPRSRRPASRWSSRERLVATPVEPSRPVLVVPAARLRARARRRRRRSLATARPPRRRGPRPARRPAAPLPGRPPRRPVRAPEATTVGALTAGRPRARRCTSRRSRPWPTRVALGHALDLATASARPDGCPWDREQTHESLRNHLLEEAYEVYDALEAGRDAGARRRARRPAAPGRPPRPARRRGRASST